MTNRRSWLSDWLKWLPLVLVPVVGRGQHPGGVAEGTVPPAKKGEFLWPWQTKKPLNNQCPVCGTLAKPYVRPTQTSWPYNCRPVQGKDRFSAVMECDPAAQIPYGPTEQLVRCAQCSNAFFRDAETRDAK